MKLLAVVLLSLTAACSALYTSSDDVVELTEANFKTRVLQSDEFWLVEFYAPWCGHCKSLAPEWKKAATALKGVVNVGAVDMTAHQSVGAPYNVQGFPTIKIFGANKQKPQDYNGARTAQAIVDQVIGQLRIMVNERLSGKSGGSGSGGSGSGGSGKKAGDSKDVIELTDSNFEELVLNSDDMWLVEFFAPWCGHCKNLAPHWATAATELKGKVKLGALDATVHTVMSNRYGVRGFPTIKYFPAGKKTQSDAEEFNGGRTSDDIVNWALEKLAANVPAPDIIELTDESVLKAACDDHQLCVVAVLPHILDCQSQCRNDYLSLLRRLGEKHKKRMWAWVWSEAGSQMAVEEAFNIGGFGYPAMAALNARKMKFSLLKGSFSEKGINEFLLEVAAGRSSTEPLRAEKLPTVKTIPQWDGKDGELPAEEELDLDDVFDESDAKKTEL
jgi:protein disulfide-isomerase A6